MRLSRRLAFTLVELLVVISIIGMLAALLLPAINSAREAARKNVCISNQREVALAIVQYEIVKGEYPGFVVPQAVLPHPTDALKKVATRPISWAFAILPWLERRDIVESYGAAAPTPYASDMGPYAAPNIRLNIFVCPSDAWVDREDPEGLTDMASQSYIVNCGLKDEFLDMADIGLKSSPTAPPIMVEAPERIPRDWAANGIFHHHFPYVGPNSAGLYEPSQERVTHVKSPAIQDGTATTLMLTENVDSGNWTDVSEQHVGFYWLSTYDMLDSKQPPMPLCCVGECAWPCPPCGLWEFLSVGLLRINERAGSMHGTPTSTMPCGRQLNWNYGRPSSFHPNGVVATFADAHVSFLNEDIDYLVFCLLMSPVGKQTRPAGRKSVDPAGVSILFADMEKGRSQYARTTLNEDAY